MSCRCLGKTKIIRSSGVCWQQRYVRDEASWIQPIGGSSELLPSEVTHRRETLYSVLTLTHGSSGVRSSFHNTQGLDVVLHRHEMTKVRAQPGTVT